MTSTEVLRRTGLRSVHLYALALGSIGLCIGLWIRAKTVDQDERGNAERRALFVGLWPPMFWLIGNSLRDTELARSGCSAASTRVLRWMSCATSLSITIRREHRRARTSRGTGMSTRLPRPSSVRRPDHRNAMAPGKQLAAW
jgi:hypothetical protein